AAAKRGRVTLRHRLRLVPARPAGDDPRLRAGGAVLAAASRAEDVQAAVDHRRILFRGHPPPRAVAHLPYGRARPLAYQVARHSAAPAFCPTLAVPGAARGGDLRRGPFPVSRPPDVP